MADYNYDPVQSILIIFSKLFANDHKSCLVVKFSTSPHMLPLYLVKHNALFCTNYPAYRTKYVFSSGGCEKNRLITGADVRTGDLLPSRIISYRLSSAHQYRIITSHYITKHARFSSIWLYLGHNDVHLATQLFSVFINASGSRWIPTQQPFTNIFVALLTTTTYTVSTKNKVNVTLL